MPYNVGDMQSIIGQAGDLFVHAKIEAAAGNWVGCRFVLEEYFAQHPQLAEADYANVDYGDVLDLFTLLSETGLCDSPDNSVTRKIFISVSAQAIRRAPQEVKDMMDAKLMELWPDLRQHVVGYDENDKPVFHLTGAAKAFGLTEDEIIEILNQSDWPETTVHSIQ
ncbi:MAG: hypothetical protein HQK57_02240 [Deltaproteobacteria bacterium]|nr:hypothetical protein [Deltaproteobacteria bacterium]MBF0527446.1 hypothetical protein [Deltaproteobacteria bacterium]